jgi:Rha family phage regulatory protein
MNAIALSPEQFIFAHDHELKTTSLKIAEAFEKRHADVLRSIEKITSHASDIFTQRNFALSEYIDESGKSNKLYNLTRDGFIMVVMSFTGEKAMAIKEAYINAFNAMAEKLFPTRYGLLELPEPPTITNAQAGQLFNTVNSIAGDDNKIRASIWSRFQKHFELNSYKVLPADRFDEAVEYLEQRRDEYRDGAKLFYISDRELEALVAERAKALEGEIMDKPPTNPTINIDLNMPEGMRQLTVSFNSQPVLGGRWSMWHSGDQLVIRPMANNEFITSSEKLADVIADSMGMAVHSKDLPSICRAAAQRMESRQLK